MNCLQSKIHINNSTIEKLFKETNKVLENVKLFWKTETPYRLTLGWAPETYPIHFQEFESQIKKLDELTLDERIKDSVYVFADKIVKVKKILDEKVLPLICSYLPQDSFFEMNIHLASFIYLSGPDTSEPKYQPNAFVQEPNIIVNLSSSYWTQDEKQLLNLMIHEIYHIGFANKLNKYRPDITIKTIEMLKENLMWLLYFEGLATYVGYRALTVFPDPDMGDAKSAGSYDYKMLEDTEEIKKAFSSINTIFSEINSLPYNEAEELIRNKGVMERAVYVVGAYMSKLIEKKMTKNELLATIEKGPMEFLELYNELESDLKLVL